MKSNKSYKITFAAIGAVLNMLGSMITMVLRIPIYMDTLGTVFVSRTLGFKYAIFTSIAGSIINSTYDPYALYFIPVGLTVALVSHISFSKDRSDIAHTLIIGIPAMIVSSFVTAYVFGGITSSSSSILLHLLHTNGLSLLASTVIVQTVTDLIDKYVIVRLSSFLQKVIPDEIKLKLEKEER